MTHKEDIPVFFKKLRSIAKAFVPSISGAFAVIAFVPQIEAALTTPLVHPPDLIFTLTRLIVTLLFIASMALGGSLAIVELLIKAKSNG